MSSPFTFVIVLVGLVLAYKLVLEAVRRQHDAAPQEETRLLQDIHRNLARLEERIEALETLVIDKSRVDDFDRRLSS